MFAPAANLTEAWSFVENVCFVGSQNVNNKNALEVITKNLGTSMPSTENQRVALKSNLPKFTYFGDEVSQTRAYLKETCNPILEQLTNTKTHKGFKRDNCNFVKMNDKCDFKNELDHIYDNNEYEPEMNVAGERIRNMVKERPKDNTIDGYRKTSDMKTASQEDNLQNLGTSEVILHADRCYAPQIKKDKMDVESSSFTSLPETTPKSTLHRSNLNVGERTLGDGQESLVCSSDDVNEAESKIQEKIYSNILARPTLKNSTSDGGVHSSSMNYVDSLDDIRTSDSDTLTNDDTSDTTVTSSTLERNGDVNEEEQLSVQYLSNLHNSLVDSFDSIDGTAPSKSDDIEEKHIENDNSVKSSGWNEAKTRNAETEKRFNDYNQKNKENINTCIVDTRENNIEFRTRNPAFMHSSSHNFKDFFKRTKSDVNLAKHRKPPSSDVLSPLKVLRSKSFLNPAIGPVLPETPTARATVDMIRQNYINNLSQVSSLNSFNDETFNNLLNPGQINPLLPLDYMNPNVNINQMSYALQKQMIQKIRQQHFIKQQQIQLQQQQELQKQQELIRQIKQQRLLQLQKQKMLEAGKVVRRNQSLRSPHFMSSKFQLLDAFKNKNTGDIHRKCSNRLKREKFKKLDEKDGNRINVEPKLQLPETERNVKYDCDDTTSQGESFITFNNEESTTGGPVYTTVCNNTKNGSRKSGEPKTSRSNSQLVTTQSPHIRQHENVASEATSKKKTKRQAPDVPGSKNTSEESTSQVTLSGRSASASVQATTAVSTTTFISQDCPYIDPLDKIPNDHRESIARFRRKYEENSKRYKNVDSPIRGSSHHRGPRSDRSSVDGPVGAGGGSGQDDASSVGSESFSKDVAILNSCFDDIEGFIARLQHISIATQELEKRRLSRKSKKKDIGDGLLSMRAKPPPEIEFVEILQKFKLAFNMLGKLRTYIHEPNAPELVHFIFTPLALIVEASREANYGTNLPAKVVTPLLSAEAVDLLTNCLSSRETELWQSLDDAWTVHRDAWKYPVPPYQPMFASGWAPELPDESREHRGEHKQRHREDYDEYYSGNRHGASSPPGRYGRYGNYSESSVSGSEVEGGSGAAASWLATLTARGARIVQVTYPRTANNDKELTVTRGELLEVMDDSRKWWKCSNARGNVGHVPHTIVTPYTLDAAAEGMAGGSRSEWSRKEGGIGWPGVCDSYSCTPESSWSISSGIYSGYDTSSDTVSSAPSPPRPTKKSSSKRSPKIPPTPIPAPPPPPPPDFTPGNTLAERPPRKLPVNSKQVFGTSRYANDLVTYELKGVLEEFRKRKPHIDVQRTPDVYVDNRATPAEVQDWLKKKNFSERVCKQFDGVDGEKLFGLTKDQLRSFCGDEEGNRLFSQITIQRNVSGYKTVNTSELKRILSEQRKRVETDDIDNVVKDFSFLQDYSKSDQGSEEDEDQHEDETVGDRKPKKSSNSTAKNISNANNEKSSNSNNKQSSIVNNKQSSSSSNINNLSNSNNNSKKTSSSTKKNSSSKTVQEPSSKPKQPQQPASTPKPSISRVKPKPKELPSSKARDNNKTRDNKGETGTLKEQIKKQRRKIIYKTDDDDDR